MVEDRFRAGSFRVRTMKSATILHANLWQDGLTTHSTPQTLIVFMERLRLSSALLNPLRAFSPALVVLALVLSGLLPGLHDELSSHTQASSHAHAHIGGCTHSCCDIVQSDAKPCDESPEHDHRSCGICKMILLAPALARTSVPDFHPARLALLTIQDCVFDRECPRAVCLEPAAPPRGPPKISADTSLLAVDSIIL